MHLVISKARVGRAKPVRVKPFGFDRKVLVKFGY